jgi:tRNA-splicing ligase RtcB
MKTVYSTETKPIKSWVTDLEDGALEQAKNLANLPFVFKHIALMPDSHQGYGMPIGGVMATQGVVIPNAVGVDIGCGMCVVKTDLREISKENLIKIGDKIRRNVPTGFSRQAKAQDKALMPNPAGLLFWDQASIIQDQFENALTQLGTLGGGNHFIEIQKGDDGFIYVMIHSGSRNLGKRVADFYNKEAVKLNEQWFSSIPKEHQLAFLPLNTQMGQDYMREMQYCVDFALANRKLMMKNIERAFTDIVKVEFGKLHNIAHNYARLENHYHKNVVVHRKGATSAAKGEIGIIPGSQGTKSFIVKGLGNAESFKSCSHGAGRKMGRNVATKTLDLKAEIKRLDDIGVIHNIKTVKDLDEAAGAYKDIDIVMENQKDLVKILIELTPMLVVKG